MRIIAFILFSCLFICCKSEYSEIDNTSELKLKWNKSHQDDSINRAVIGLQWALSYVGSNTPCNSKSIKVSGNIITIYPDYVGFNNKALAVFKTLISKIKQTEAFKNNNTLDLGRFITLLLASPEHYYALVGTPKTLEQLKAKYKLNAQKGYVNNSSVALQDRIISFSDLKDLNQLWISEEIDSISKTIYELETIELLKNGQLRFGIYNKNGILKNVANSKHTAAGKPGKCIWCHESNLNQMFKKQDNVYGFLSADALQQKIKASRDTFKRKRKLLKETVDFNKKQQHTFTEILYISFLEPSAKRLSLEWNINEDEVVKSLKHLKTHKHKEFQFLGDLYYRKDVEQFAPLKAIKVSSSVRELSANEINHLN
ncbi:hypothetical protein DZC78_05060 [Olleya aquimaris]|uniref:hypothetical protein n=1 Tax=Olleya sp. ITB9 TaxID=1715648 RepID=UPI0006CFD36A|nr:hypothetical protein [Olleya sp. ITB9]AXO79780.1 hypothetical protein DZC78_05060 [Olleya aquimaris]